MPSASSPTSHHTIECLSSSRGLQFRDTSLSFTDGLNIRRACEGSVLHSPAVTSVVGMAVGVLRALALTSLLTGCFYDSAWGARKAAETHNAARATPAALTSATPSASATTLRVRVHATEAYAVQTPDWKNHVRALLGEVSGFLEVSVGARLVVDSEESWSATAHPHLDGDLAALRDEDSADGTDLVIGFVGGLALTSRDFDQAGYALIGGKLVVVRAPNVALEYEAVEKAFDELSDDQRARLRRERIHHEEVAVLLHEIGHALGAEHSGVAGSLMRPAYDAKMTSFDEASLAAMRQGLAARRSEGDGRDGGASPSAVAAARTTTDSANEPDAGAEDDAPIELSAADRDLWERVKALMNSGEALAAWQAGQKIFAAYPSVYAVQDLRCKAAMGRLGSYDQARQECDPLMKITMKGAKRK